MTEAPGPMEKIEQLIEQIAEAMMEEIEAAIEMVMFTQSDWYGDLVYSLLGADPGSLGAAVYILFFWILPYSFIAMAGFPVFLAYLSLEARLLMEGDGDVDR